MYGQAAQDLPSYKPITRNVIGVGVFQSVIAVPAHKGDAEKKRSSGQSLGRKEGISSSLYYS